jgi:hypothetical protein
VGDDGAALVLQEPLPQPLRLRLRDQYGDRVSGSAADTSRT